MKKQTMEGLEDGGVINVPYENIPSDVPTR